MTKRRSRLLSFPAVLVCLLTALLSLSLSGCKTAELKFAFFIYDENDTFIAETMQRIETTIPEHIYYEIRHAGNSQSVQNQQIVEFIDQNFDLFIINAVDRLACSSIVEKCSKKNIPVIFFNREPLEGALNKDNVFYVGAAADSLGVKQADIVAELFADNFAGSEFDKNNDGTIQLIILKGEQGHQDAEKRTENCVNRLIELNYSVDILAIYSADWRRSDAYEAMRSLYTQFGNRIELIFANNDDMALGAIDFLLEKKIFAENVDVRRQPFVLVGVDGTAVGLDAIGKHLLYGTVQNDLVKQADAILTLADFIINERDMKNFPYAITNGRYIYIDGDIITKNNLAEYLQK